MEKKVKCIHMNILEQFIQVVYLSKEEIRHFLSMNSSWMSSLLSRGGQEEQPPKEGIHSTDEAHEVPGELLRQTVEMRNDRNSELRGDSVLHAQGS